MTQKASSVDVNLQSQRISSVETQIDVLNSELISQVTRAEFTTTTEDVTQLTTRMSAAEGSITTKAAQQTVDGISTRLSTAETTLSTVNTTVQSQAQQINNIQSSYQAADSANASAITALSQTVADENSATAQQLSSIWSSVNSLSSSISELQQTTTGSTESLASIYDQLKAKTDISALAAANAALSDDESTRQKRYSEASIKHDLTVLTNDHEALAQTVEVLQADFASETAAISAQIANEQTARATAVDSLAQVVSTIDANYKSADITTNARIATEETARASADSALSTRVDLVLATTNSNTAAIQSEQTARATADEALSSDIETLFSSVGNNTAAIKSEATARSNADRALSSRIDTVQATANGLTASVQTQSQAISTLNSGAQAMWTVKSQVGDITTGIGLMTDSNGKSQVMISASQLFMFDPNGAAPTRSIFAVSNGQVVMQKAVIEKATIETVTAMSITADYVRAGVRITSPAINGGTLAIGSGNNSIFLADGAIGIGKGGPYGGWGYGWHTIIYNDGGLYTDRIHASGGTFNNVTIAENCDVRGTIYANKIVGDVLKVWVPNVGPSSSLKLRYGGSFSLDPYNKQRRISFLYIDWSFIKLVTYEGVLVKSIGDSSPTVTIPANATGLHLYLESTAVYNAPLLIYI